MKVDGKPFKKSLYPVSPFTTTLVAHLINDNLYSSYTPDTQVVMKATKMSVLLTQDTIFFAFLHTELHSPYYIY